MGGQPKTPIIASIVNGCKSCSILVAILSLQAFSPHFAFFSAQKEKIREKKKSLRPVEKRLKKKKRLELYH
jgi:hypothetical protein